MLKSILIWLGTCLILAISVSNVSEMREQNRIVWETAATLIGSSENDDALYSELSIRFSADQGDDADSKSTTAYYLVNAALCGNYYSEMKEYAKRLRDTGVVEHILIIWHKDERISERVKLMASGHLDLKVEAMTNQDVKKFQKMLPVRSVMLVPGKEPGEINHIWLQSSAIDDALRSAVLAHVNDTHETYP